MIVDLSPSPEFIGSTSSYTFVPDYSTQIIRTSYTGNFPNQPLSGYFNVAYDGTVSAANANAFSVRKSLEQLPGIVTVGVDRRYASEAVDGVCVDVAVGSSTVKCSTSCTPCGFGSRGIKAN